jgi:trehalose 6-phosphate phosphatase
MGDSNPEIEALLERVAQASRSLLILDYEGTLAPLRKYPEQALPYPDPGVSGILQQIVRFSKTRVVVISGRDANDVIPLLGIQPRLEVWGYHGLQRLKPNGTSELFPPDEATVEALAAADDWLLYQQLQHAAEYKTGSIAIHWGDLNECELAEIRGRVLLGWMPIAKRTGLALLEFDGGVEIRPRKANKGAAVRTIMSEMDPDTPTAYLGDDTTDKQAFQAVNSRGLSVLVRPRWRTTSARLWLRPPDEVLEFLGQWLQACRKQNKKNDAAAAVSA